MSRTANPAGDRDDADSAGDCCNRVSNPVRDAALSSLIQRWPDLPPAIRAAIAAMVDAVPETDP